MATAGAVAFKSFSDEFGFRCYSCTMLIAERYIPGQFYRRELPELLRILELIEEEIDTIIVDGYTDLGDKQGLGRYL
jgi:deoxyribonuclease V